MDYDQLHQLRKVHQAKVNGTVVESFSYNATGDMTDHYKKGVGTTRYSYAKNNRLSAINKANRQLAVGYTPDGRITVFGDNFYGYSDDKLLTQYDTSNGDLFTYLYDGNDKKLKTLKNGELLSYSIYDHTGKLIYEEKPGDVTSNLIYLDGRLIAKRDGKYDIAYTECNYIKPESVTP
jgi:glutamine phosphoribosylpyrophosphate amidotransferase